MLRKAFSVEDANALIPVLERVFRGIDQKREHVRRHGRKLEVLNLLWGDTVIEESNPDRDEYIRHKRAIGKTVSEIEQLIQDEILRRGLRFPAGGVDSGLIDFPTTYQGRWVYLCWRNGEQELTHWHETDSGYPGRRAISDEQRETMGRDYKPSDVDDSSLDF